MSTDKKPEDQVTEAGAVELEEAQLDEAAGGVIAIAPQLKINTLEQKVSPVELKISSVDIKY